MSSTKAKRHTHKYYKVDMSGNQIWACALPDCNHYMPKYMEKLVTGKASICWGCGSDMILNPNNMKIDRPVCADCSGLLSIEDKLAMILNNNEK